MSIDASEAEVCILDVLMTSEESFPIIHSDLIKNYQFPADLDPKAVREILQIMESQGLISIWRPRPLPARYWDEMEQEYRQWLEQHDPAKDYRSDLGPWFEITPEGKARWAKTSDAAPRLRTL